MKDHKVDVFLNEKPVGTLAETAEHPTSNLLKVSSSSEVLPARTRISRDFPTKTRFLTFFLLFGAVFCTLRFSSQ